MTLNESHCAHPWTARDTSRLFTKEWPVLTADPGLEFLAALTAADRRGNWGAASSLPTHSGTPRPRGAGHAERTRGQDPDSPTDAADPSWPCF